MVIVQTVASKLTNADGTPATGRLVIQPNSVWEWDNPVTATREKVSLTPIIVPITAGAVTAFSLAPTSGANQDVTNAGYIVSYELDSGVTWQEMWDLPAATPTVELTSITLLDTSATPTIATAVKGDPGPAGPIGFTFKGAWSATTTYAAGDAVRSAEGRIFVSATSNNLNSMPPVTATSNVAWTLVMDIPTAGTVSTVPTATLLATTVQGALTELDTKKAPVAHTHLAVDVTDLATAVAADATVSANTAARHTHLNKAILDATSASYTTAEQTKLGGIATGATANSTDAFLLNRANHTGTQLLATISDAGTAAGKNVPAAGDAAVGEVVLGNDTRLSDARTPTAHTHVAADTTDFQVAVSTNTDVVANKAHTTNTSNPHGTTLAQAISAGGAQGIFGNLADPLVHIPFRRAEEITGAAAAAGAKYSGAASFSRASTATYVDPLDGLIKTAAINTPRFERMADGGTGILLEGASTNIILDSGNYSALYLGTTGATSVKNSATDVFGTPNSCTTLTLTNTLNNWDMFQTISGLTSGATYTLSMYIKLGTAANFTGTCNDTTAWNTLPSTRFNVSAADGFSTTAFKRLSLTFVAPSSGRINLHLGSTIENTLNGQQSAGTVIISAMQLEALPFASSYIPTTTVAVTRAADNLTIPSSGNVLQSIASGTVMMDYDCLDSLGSGNYNRPVSLVNNTTADAFRFGYSGTNGFNANGTIWLDHVANNMSRVAVSWDGTTKRLFIGGNFITGATSGTVLRVFPTNCNGIEVGKFSTAGAHRYHFGHVRNFRIYDRALTDTEVAAA